MWLEVIVALVSTLQSGQVPTPAPVPGVAETTAQGTSPAKDPKARLEEAERAVKLGVRHMDRGEYSRADALLTESMEVFRALLGEDHRGYAWHLNTVGCLCVWTGQFTRAEKLLTQALATYKRIV